MGIDYSLVSGYGVRVDLAPLAKSRDEYEWDTMEYIGNKYPGVTLLSASGYDADEDWVLAYDDTASYDDMRDGGGWIEPDVKPFTSDAVEDFVNAYAEITGEAWDVARAKTWFVGLNVS